MDHKGIAYAYNQKAFTLAASGNTRVSLGSSDNWPDGLIRGVWVRVWASAITLGGGAGISGGELSLIRTFSVQTRLHKMLYTSVDGKLWGRFVAAMMGQSLPQTDPTASGFSQLFYIPFHLFDGVRRPAFRKTDLGILNYKGQCKPQLDIDLGPITDIVSGGASPTCSGNIDFVIEYEPNPRPGLFVPGNPLASGDEPGLQLEVSTATLGTLTANTPEQILATGSGRRLAALLIREDTAGSPPTERSDVFTANTSTFSVKYGSDWILDHVWISSLDVIMQQKMDIALTAGYHLYIPCEDGKLTDGIDLSDGRQLLTHFDNINTSASRELTHMVFGYRDIEKAATFAAQVAASKNA